MQKKQETRNKNRAEDELGEAKQESRYKKYYQPSLHPSLKLRMSKKATADKATRI